jgi:GH3 auxin-responsive promoter
MSTPDDWLRATLARNAHCAYLRGRRFEELTIVTYDELVPWIDRIVAGESDVLFTGRPVAYERTSGSSGAAKLIPYSAEGLRDFQRSLVPWIEQTVRDFAITGGAYFAISPATRPPESIGGVPVGLPDAAYLGDDVARWLAASSVVPVEVARITDVAKWRDVTLRHLAAARDLELISVWSPTFLLRLLDDLDDPVKLWPRLKLVSCWASAASKPFAMELAARLPHAALQPKGLLSTECVVTVPLSPPRGERVAEGRVRGASFTLTPHGYFEFESHPPSAAPRTGKSACPPSRSNGDVVEVIATTASGLYRYRTGDLLRDGEFIGRKGIVSDLVGEKLTEPFVAKCLENVRGYLFPEGRGYVVASETHVDLDAIEQKLGENPQYAYARKLGQLAPLRAAHVRCGPEKPVALRP